MALADAIPAGPDPFKVLLSTFGALAEQNNKRKEQELAQKKLDLDAIQHAASLNLQERIFGLDKLKYGSINTAREAKIAADMMKLQEFQFDKERERDFNNELNNLEVDGMTIQHQMQYGTPEQKAEASNKFDAVANRYRGFKSPGIKTAIDQIESTDYRRARRELNLQKEARAQEDLERKNRQGDTRLDQGQQKIEISKGRAETQKQAAAEKAARKDEEVIHFPTAAGGGSKTMGVIRSIFGRAKLEGPDSQAFKDAEVLQKQLNMVGPVVLDPKTQTYSVPEPLFSAEDYARFADEGANKLRGGKLKTEFSKPSQSGAPALPTGPETPYTEPGAELMPENLTPTERLRNKFPGVAPKGTPSPKTSAIGIDPIIQRILGIAPEDQQSVGFGGFGVV